ncbi:MAG: hypothetical protein ABR568_05845 [Pyrinomonadaceae bacterium]
MSTRFPVSMFAAYRDLAEAGDRETLRGNNINEVNKLEQTLNRLNGAFSDEALNAQSWPPRFRQNNGTPLLFHVFSNSHHSCGQLSWSTTSGNDGS